MEIFTTLHRDVYAVKARPTSRPDEVTQVLANPPGSGELEHVGRKCRNLIQQALESLLLLQCGQMIPSQPQDFVLETSSGRDVMLVHGSHDSRPCLHRLVPTFRFLLNQAKELSL